MKLQSVVLVMALAFATLSGACGSSSPSGTGGSSGTGTGGNGTAGTTGTGGASCPDVAACGGSVVGTWTVMSSCLTVNGTVDPSWLGLDPRTCTGVSISGSLSVSGTFTANANGTYTDGTTTTGQPRLDLVAGCLMLSGTKIDCGGVQRTIAGATCTSASNGGCTCTLAVNQTGGIGVISNGPSRSDSYRTAGNVVTLTTDAGDENYAYCVAGNQMTWTPQDVNLPIKGTIVLANSGGTGSGGTSGTGGASGTTGTGGTTGAGGSSTGSGGSTGGTGGSSTGGRGGTTGTGGSAGGQGGSSGRGGTTGAGGS
ncbi:MAG TPA: hypothetical protein VIF57_10040, partial [Polyangia bacterium]